MEGGYRRMEGWIQDGVVAFRRLWMEFVYEFTMML